MGSGPCGALSGLTSSTWRWDDAAVVGLQRKPVAGWLRQEEKKLSQEAGATKDGHATLTLPATQANKAAKSVADIIRVLL